MAITKTTEIAKIEVVGEYKAVQVATDTVIKEDGKEISRNRHRHVVHSDMDISGEDAEVEELEATNNSAEAAAEEPSLRDKFAEAFSKDNLTIKY